MWCLGQIVSDDWGVSAEAPRDAVDLWYYWRGTVRRGGITAEGWRDTVAAERLRDAVPAATQRDMTQGIPTVHRRS